MAQQTLFCRPRILSMPACRHKSYWFCIGRPTCRNQPVTGTMTCRYTFAPGAQIGCAAGPNQICTGMPLSRTGFEVAIQHTVIGPAPGRWLADTFAPRAWISYAAYSNQICIGMLQLYCSRCSLLLKPMAAHFWADCRPTRTSIAITTLLHNCDVPSAFSRLYVINCHSLVC